MWRKRMEKSKQNRRRFAGACIMALLPLFACCLYTLTEGRSPFAVYIPAGGWNDELFYYKQIEAMVAYGRPQGYFGYNETTARLLSFGPWSVVLLLPYMLVGKVVGWTFGTPVLCNMLFMAGAFFCWGFCVKGTKLEKGLTAVTVLSFTSATRYILSGMVEPLNFALLVVVLSFSVKAVQEEGEKKGTLYALLALCMLFTLMRPYYLVFFLFPGYYLVKKQGKKGGFFTALALCAALAVYFWINSNLCAPYVYPIIYTDWLRAFREQGFLRGLVYCIQKYGKGWAAIFSMAGASLLYRNDVMGKWWLLYLLEMAGFLWCAIRGFGRIRRQKAQNGDDSAADGTKTQDPAAGRFFLDVSMAGIFFVIASMMIMLYEVDTGSRHVMALCLGGILVYLWRRGRQAAGILAAMFVLVNVFVQSTGFWASPLTYRTSEAVSLEERREADLGVYMQLDEAAGASWDNTVAWHSLVDYRILYSLCPGFGIQYDESVVFTERMDSVKSKYIMVLPDSEADQAVREAGASLLFEDGDYRLYENPNFPDQKE